MADNASQSAPPRVYRMSPLRRAILDGIALLMLAIPTAIAIADPAASGGAVIVFLVLLPTLAFLLFSAWYPRLTVLADGIRVRGAIGYSTLSIPWSNVERFGMEPGREGLILREPLQTRAAKSWKNWSGLSYMGAGFYDAQQRVFIDQQRYVPMQMFAYWLRRADLTAQLASYVPALADELRSHELTYRQAQTAANRRALWIFGVALLLIAAATVYAFWSRSLPPAERAALEHGEHAIDRFAGRAFAVALAIYALSNLQAARGFWRRKHPGYALFWLLFAVMQILLVIGIFIG